jgi:hypothetical protein
VWDADPPTFTEAHLSYRSKFWVRGVTVPESLDAPTSGVERFGSEARDPEEEDRKHRADSCLARFNARSTSTVQVGDGDSEDALVRV